MIVLVNVTSSDGSHSVKTTALLDYGSNATLWNHEPELLIGADNYEALIIQDKRLGNKGQPAAVHTPLGWTLIGKDVSKGTNGMSINFANVERDVLCEQLQRMFNCDFSESDFTEEFAPSIEDTRALSIMKDSICKVDGHYQMRLPWKCEEPQFPQSYKFAKKRLDYLKRKFQRDPGYFDKYKEKIHEYIDNDYAKKIPEDHVPSDERKIWYLPHHSTGEKFRLVFDCSFKVDNISLNNHVLQGPDHCLNLVGVLTRFRQEDIAFVCDIKGMFHQVKVHPDDWDSLKFLWYPNDDISKEPESYFMTRSLFGLTSSPSEAGYALKRAAIDNETNANIDVLNTVNNNFYVDDCLKSCDSSHCAIDVINQLNCLLSNVGFHLTKYRSNFRSVLSSISDIDKAKDSFLDLTLDKSYCSKTLGIIWNNVNDQFTVKVDIKPKPLTRRGCLSMISQIYDPLGMMQPFILPMKSLMQTLCAQDIGWDSLIPTRYEEIWQKWVNELPKLQEVSIPRCFKPPGFKTDHIELHTFCDASQVGYGAEHWPKRPEVLPQIPENDPEVKTIINTNVNMEKDNVKSVLSMLMERYSDYGRLQRAIAWIIRYLHKVKFQDIGRLNIDELDYATHEILRITQRDVFSKEMKYLGMINKEHKVPKSQLCKGQCQSLQNLCPFIKDELMRIGGRLQHSLLPLHSKHQIILPKDHHVTRLLIKKYHEQEGHSGTLHVLAVIRERYWIIDGQSTVRSYLRKCLKCRMQRAKVGKQVMAPLPASRVTPGHPAYTWTGIDYMGPVIIKQGRSTIKRYVCVFTCMSSRAVHLEVSHSLETNSFLNALERFSSRHIMPKEIYCDNASTFVGAERELKAAIKSWNNDQVHNYMLNRGVKFIHSPPLASHQGGCWERIIRTVRKVLYALVGERVLDDEGLQTFQCIVERIINNRPITSSSDDAADAPPLTPKMMLTGQLESSLSPGEFNRADGYRKSWKLVHRLADQFWSQWIKQYLPQLQARQKWLHPERNFRKGDLVLVVDVNTKRGLWPKGIIRETFPDSNGHVRRVRVDTASSSFIRDIRKLCFLEEL
ncbi:uncharacterized protein LOC144411797 [Styela clava]